MPVAFIASPPDPRSKAGAGWTGPLIAIVGRGQLTGRLLLGAGHARGRTCAGRRIRWRVSPTPSSPSCGARLRAARDAHPRARAPRLPRLERLRACVARRDCFSIPHWRRCTIGLATMPSPPKGAPPARSFGGRCAREAARRLRTRSWMKRAVHDCVTRAAGLAAVRRSV